MATRRRVVRASALACLLALAVTAAAPSSSATPGGGLFGRSKVKVLAEGLSSPKGVTATWLTDPAVSQGAFGPPGPVLRVPQLGRHKGQVFPVSDPMSLTDIAASPKDGTGWGLGNIGDPSQEPDHVYVYHQTRFDELQTLLDVTEYQQTDPDPTDQEGNPTESNPYGLTVDRRGNAYVVDAANNDLIKITPAGVATTVARFDVQTVSTDHIPGAPLPPTIDAEAVPTTVAVGPDGYLYVGELKGFPFRPGTSNIWRIDPQATGTLCSVNTPTAGCTVHLDGFTGIQDIAFSPWFGQLHVLELSADGVLAFEEGFSTGAFPPAVLLRVTRSGRTELVPGQLSQPGGIAFNWLGQLFATDGMFGNGRLLQIS